MLTQIRRDFRPIQRAIALSLLLHVTLLAVTRSTPSLSTDPNMPIDLRLWIEAPGEQTIEHDEIAAGPPRSPCLLMYVSRVVLPMAVDGDNPGAAEPGEPLVDAGAGRIARQQIQPATASLSAADAAIAGAEPGSGKPPNSSLRLVAILTLLKCYQSQVWSLAGPTPVAAS